MKYTVVFRRYLKIMKIKSKIVLKKKLKLYDAIIFDLDDTIYPQKNYDNPALYEVSKFISKKFHIDEKKIYVNLRRIKPIRRGKKPILIFNYFLSKFTNFKNKTFVNKLVKIFQSYDCIELKKSSSLKNLLREIYKNKDLFLVTNGHYARQLKKIKYLGISKYFKKIFILDDVKKKIKPSIEDVKYLVKYLNKDKNKKVVYVGDNINSDKNFAKNLMIKFIHFEFS